MCFYHHHERFSPPTAAFSPSPPVFTITTLVFTRFHLSYVSFSLIHHLFTNVVLDTLVIYHLVSRVGAAPYPWYVSFYNFNFFHLLKIFSKAPTRPPPLPIPPPPSPWHVSSHIGGGSSSGTWHIMELNDYYMYTTTSNYHTNDNHQYFMALLVDYIQSDCMYS